MKKFAAVIGTISLLLLPGLASAQSYYDYGYPSYGYSSGYPNYYGYGYGNQGYMNQLPTFYSWGNPSMSVPEYGCGDHYQYTPCTSYTYQPNYQTQMYQNQTYSPQTYSYSYPSYFYSYPQTNYYYPQTYMPQTHYYPQQYSYPYMFNNNLNMNTNINNVTNNNNSSATAIVYIPGYGLYRY